MGQSPYELKPGTQDASTSTEVGERSPLPPRKPPRSLPKPPHHCSTDERTSSISITESFTNVKNPSLESIDELSSLKNFTAISTTESCFNSHYQQTAGFLLRSKSLSPHTPQSPRDGQQQQQHSNNNVQDCSPNSSGSGHQQQQDFASDEFYIDESLPSSLSIEQSQGEVVKQLDTANNVVALLQVFVREIVV